MSLSQITSRMIKNVTHLFGFDIIRTKNSPSVSLLGLWGFPFRTIIDVGANTGQFAKKVSKIFPNAKLFCFEPLPEPFDVLSTWSKRQQERVISFNLALGDKEREVKFFLHEDHTPSSSILKTTNLNEQIYPFTKKQRAICVKQTTLDNVFQASNVELSPKLLIKVDVQGYEDRVIAGGHKTFAAASACILEIGIDTLYEGQTGFMDLLRLLNDIGYRYAGNMNQTYGNDGHCIFLDAVFLKKDESSND